MSWDSRDSDIFPDNKPQTQTQWETGVNQTFSEIMSPRSKVGRAVIDELVAWGTEKTETVTLAPFTVQDWAKKIPEKRNAGALAVDPSAATVLGQFPDELPDSQLRRIGNTPEGPQRDALVASVLGTGKGSSADLLFSRQDWAQSGPSAGLDAADETLLHEIVHCVRQLSGMEQSGKLINNSPTIDKYQTYDSVEEFAAIVITNVYRSESGRKGLRADHTLDPTTGKDKPLMFPLTNARNFVTAWRQQMLRLQTDLPRLCRRLAEVDCAFNPFFELYQSQNRFMPGTRIAV
jgi:hypothetical protein